MLRTRTCSKRAFAPIRLALYVLQLSANGCTDTSSEPGTAPANDTSTMELDSAVDASIEQPNLRSGQATWSALTGGQRHQGLTLAEWVLSWTHWYMSANSCDTAETDLDGSGCSLFQDPDSAAFFLARGEYLTVRTRCHVSRNLAVVVPIVFFIAGLTPSPLMNSPSPAKLDENAREIAATMRDIVFQVDGVEMLEINHHRIDSTMFSETIPSEPNRLSCEGNEGSSGSVGPFFITGFFALLPPGAVGRHVITYGGTYSINGIDVVDRVRATIYIE